MCVFVCAHRSASVVPSRTTGKVSATDSQTVKLQVGTSRKMRLFRSTWQPVRAFVTHKHTHRDTHRGTHTPDIY